MKRVPLAALLLAMGCTLNDPPREINVTFVLPRAGEIQSDRLPLETRVRVDVYRPDKETIAEATSSGASDCKATLEADGSITLFATTPGATTLGITLRKADGTTYQRTNDYVFASLKSLKVRRSLQRSPASESDVLLVGHAFEWCTNGYDDEDHLVPGLAIQIELSPRLLLERPQFLGNDTSDGLCALYRSNGPTAGVVVFRAGKLRRAASVAVVEASRVTKVEWVSLGTLTERKVETTEPSKLAALVVRDTFDLPSPSCAVAIGARYTIDDGRMGLLPRSAITSPSDLLLSGMADNDASYILVRFAGEIEATAGVHTAKATISAGSCQ